MLKNNHSAHTRLACDGFHPQNCFADRPHMEKKWFEMAQIRKRRFDSAVWILLRACEVTKSGKSGNLGYQEEFFGAGSLAIPLRRRKAAAKLGWHDLGLLQDYAGYADGHRYRAADEYADKELKGAVRLVISQRGNSAEPSTWHLHTDFLTTLGLKREGIFGFL